MTRIEAYRILSKMWNDATPEQDEAINIAMDAIEFVDLMPKDAVPVVRCKECKHYHLYDEGFRDCRHSGGLDDAYPDDYCSYGERKDGDSDGILG